MPPLLPQIDRVRASHLAEFLLATLQSRIRNRALSFAHRGPSIDDICIRREVLCPPEDQECRPESAVRATSSASLREAQQLVRIDVETAFDGCFR